MAKEICKSNPCSSSMLKDEAERTSAKLFKICLSFFFTLLDPLPIHKAYSTLNADLILDNNFSAFAT
mgnify:CR=1 FL=1